MAERQSVPAGCPDGGTCHHACPLINGHGVPCFRVLCCGPLSGVYAGDTWPGIIRRTHQRARDNERAAEEPHRCLTCGLPDGPDYGDPHECPPGFQTSAPLPDTINVTAFARWVLALHADHLLGGPYRGALGAWAEATGAPDDDTALAWAREVAARPGRVTAALPPF